MTSLKNMCLGVALLVLGSTSVWAAPLNGSFTFGQTGLSFSPDINPNSYDDYSGTATWNSTLGSSFDDFVDHAGDFTPANSQSMTLDGTNQSGYSQTISWDFDGFGNFSGMLTGLTVAGDGNGVNATYTGTFSPSFTGHDPSDAVLNISFSRATILGNAVYNLSGTVIAAGTATVPEPATVALAAFGALALGFVARRRS